MAQYEQYLTTSEFAKICGISKHTLFHYDDIGLLKPELVAENGYRYYALHQFFVFDIIAVLKQAGTPLSEIKGYLQQQDPAHFLSILTEKEKKLDAERRKIEKMQRVLKNTIAETELGLRSAGSGPRFETHPEQYLVAARLSSDDSDKEMVIKTYDHYYDCLDKELYEGLPVGFIISRDQLLHEADPKPEAFFIQVSAWVDDPRLLVKSAGQYAVIDHHGSYNNINDSRAVLTAYVANCGRSVTGDTYEFELLGYMAAGNTDQYVIRLAIGVG